MERIDSQHPDQATLARKVLCWVFHTSRPLSMAEIQHALAVEPGDSALDEDNIPERELLLSVCNGLVTYEKERGFLALVHYTFQQYLEQKAEALFPEAQAEIVRTCLTYLSFDEFGQGPCHQDRDLMVRRKRWPLLRYAVSKWGQHARQGAEETCRDLIISFLSQDAKLSASIQLLWVRKSIDPKYMLHFPLKVSALWFASLYGLERTVSHLLASQRHSVDRKTTWGDTALHRAAGCGHVRILELLLNHGADVNAKDRAGNTSLHMASFNWSNWVASDWFNSMGQETWCWTEIKLETSDMSLDVTRLLLDHGADVNAVDIRGETPLYNAIKNGQKSVTQLLLARGADVILENQSGHTPLTLASEYEDEEITRVLLEHDLQRQVQSGITNTAMRIAAYNGRFSMVKILLSRSLEETLIHPEGINLLHLSAFVGSLECLVYFQNNGFDLEVLDEQKRTCLHIAAASTQEGSRAIVKYLLKRGLNPRQSDVHGWTPLLWAAKGGNTTNIQELLKADADSFCQGDKEWIPFAIATFHENFGAARILKPPNKLLPEVFRNYQSGISLRHPGVHCDGCDLVSHGCVNSFCRKGPLTLSASLRLPLQMLRMPRLRLLLQMRIICRNHAPFSPLQFHLLG